MQRLNILLDQMCPALPIRYSDEVAACLLRRPAVGKGAKDGLSPRNADFAKVVALESTIISHGMPYPQNVECAKDLEAIVRSEGAVPATIAILNGVVHVGLNPDQLELLGKLGSQCAKVSRRDLPHIIAAKRNGATTVSATILIAQHVGIDIMATGGIGGVHRRGESTMDVSTDLTELGRTKVLVVCAGVKSILDIPRTLEVLETQGVGVFGYQTSEFPAFFTRHSGCKAPLTMDTPTQGANYLLALRQLGYASGGILGVPIPEEYEAEGKVVEDAIKVALKECDEKGVLGRDVTPFLLKRVNELTEGKSLKSNIALVKNNTRVASQIAVAYHKLILTKA
jgi:pseudouridylate synthase